LDVNTVQVAIRAAGVYMPVINYRYASRAGKRKFTWGVITEFPEFFTSLKAETPHHIAHLVISVE
jgi:hypothetical protein